MATIYRLTIDPIALGITKPIDKVYIKNLYVDTDDTHIRTAPFEYVASVISDLSLVELPPTTLGSIYQLQLFGSEGMVLSVFFGMPKRNTKLSELDIFTAYPPRSYYPEASVAWGQLSGAIANQADLVDVMFTKSSASAMQAAIDSKNSLQDTAINLRATTASVNAKNALQDTAIDTNKSAISNNKVAIESKVDNAVAAINSQIALKANTADVNSKNALQDSAITALQDKNVSQDAAIELRAITTEVGAALDLKANTSDVNSKNTLQDNAITAAQNKADAAIPKSEKGAANGVATLDADGKISPLQIPTEQPIAWGGITGDIADQTDLGTAATRNIGEGIEDVPLVKDLYLLSTRTVYSENSTSINVNALQAGQTVFVSQGASNSPGIFGGYKSYIFTRSNSPGSEGYLHQDAYDRTTGRHAFRVMEGGVWTGWQTTYSTSNVTKDSNGFLKGASPVIDMYDNKIDLNHDATEQGGITFEKIGTGDYLISGSLGFAQEGWYIETPKDANGNVLVAVVYEQLENNDLSIKTYAKRFDEETGDIVANLLKPRDIPDGRFISLRLHELPKEPSVANNDLPAE